MSALRTLQSKPPEFDGQEELEDLCVMVLTAQRCHGLHWDVLRWVTHIPSNTSEVMRAVLSSVLEIKSKETPR